jgi:hypothetical protein
LVSPPVAELGGRTPLAARDNTGSLLSHLVCDGQQRFRDGEAERFGGFEVDDQFEFGWLLLDRQIGRFLAFENAPGIDASLVVPTPRLLP